MLTTVLPEMQVDLAWESQPGPVSLRYEVYQPASHS